MNFFKKADQNNPCMDFFPCMQIDHSRWLPLPKSAKHENDYQKNSRMDTDLSLCQMLKPNDADS